MLRPRIAIAPFLTVALLTFASLVIPGACLHARAQQPQATIADDTARGIKLYEKGETEKAIELLKQVIKNRPDDADAWYYLGLAYNRQGLLYAAHPAFQKVVDLRPQFAAARAHLAYNLLLANNIDRAAEEATYAVSLGERTAQMHYVIGEVALRREDYEKALEKADASLELDPGYSSALILRSLALIGLKRPQDSAPSLDKLLSLNTSDSTSEWRAQVDELRRIANKAPAQQGDTSDQIFKGPEVTTKVRILERPEPSYTEKARKAGVVGTVVLQAVFSSDATLKRILVIQWLPFGLTERALEAARGIKFTPATKDGRPVSMFYRIEYNFNLH